MLIKNKLKRLLIKIKTGEALKVDFWLYADSICSNYRSNNEDYYRCIYLEERQSYLLCLADGMGGENGGEIAGQLAIDNLAAYLVPQLVLNVSARQDRACLLAAFNAANTAVYKAACHQVDLKNMGSTLIVALINKDGQTQIANIGDSRAYHWHEQELVKISNDHNYASQLLKAGEISQAAYQIHPGRHMLTKAIGCAAYITPDIFTLQLESGDKLLLCSDGIHGYLSEAQIKLALNQGKTAEASTRLLMQTANLQSKDNATVICLAVG